MQLEDILKKYSQELTPTQITYMTEYLRLGSFRKVAKSLGLDESTVRRCVRSIQKRYNARSTAVPEHTSEDIPTPFGMKGYSAYYDEDGNRRGHWVKTDIAKEQVYQDLVEAVSDLSQSLPARRKRKKTPKKVDKDLLTVYPLGDPHIGLLTYAPEVNQNWDLKIAEKMFLPLFEKLVKAAPGSEECVVLDLGDFWHYDAMDQRTTRSGHKVDADGRPSKMIQVGYRIMTQIIDSALDVHKRVRVQIMPGNHDDLGSIFMRVSLAHVYRNEPRVIVEQTPNVFQYFQWGNNLVGSHHGDKCKMAQLPMVMAADKPLEWGQCKHRYWYVGHFHHDSTTIHNGKEMAGCKVETFRTIVATEGYAHEAGYRSGQDGKAIVLHKEYGEVSRHTVNLDQVR